MTDRSESAPALAIMLRRWLLMMLVVVPTVGLGLLLQALVLPGDFGSQLQARWGEHLGVILVVGAFTLLLSLAGASLMGGGAGLRLRDFEDHDGKRLARVILMTCPIYLLSMGIGSWIRGEAWNALLLGVPALMPSTIESFLAVMQPPAGRR